MLLQNWWFTTLMGADTPAAPPLVGDQTADCVIVGAGMAGISAALRLRHLGPRLLVLDRNVFDGSSTGKSAGFLTPDSELERSQVIRRYGVDGAKAIWAAPVAGVASITQTVRENYSYFGVDRSFLLPTWLERVLGKPLVFSLNNAWAKYRQVDRAP